jgi:hypothetical protein
MIKPKIERIKCDASEAPEGWITVASLQINGIDLAIQISDWVIPELTRRRIESAILALADALYRVRPDLGPQ